MTVVADGSPSTARRVGPTRLGRGVLLATLPLASLAVLTSDTWLFLLGAAFVGAVAADALAVRRGTGGLRVEVDVPPRTTAGERFPCRLTLRNAARATTPPVTVTHRRLGLDEVRVLVEPLPGGATSQPVLPRRATDRGAWTCSVVELEAAGPFGLVAYRRSDHTHPQPPVLVHPAAAPAAPPPPEGRGDDGQPGVVDRSGLDVRGIREFRAGDATGSIHWRSSARRGRLVVLEREVPRGRAVSLLVAGRAGDPGWEALLSRAAATAVEAVRAGRPVTLAARQAGLEQPRATHEVAVLDWFARLHEPAPPDYQDVWRAVDATGAGGVVVIATTWSGDAWWDAVRSAAVRADVTVVPLTPPEPAGSRGPARAARP